MQVDILHFVKTTLKAKCSHTNTTLCILISSKLRNLTCVCVCVCTRTHLPSNQLQSVIMFFLIFLSSNSLQPWRPLAYTSCCPFTQSKHQPAFSTKPSGPAKSKCSRHHFSHFCQTQYWLSKAEHLVFVCSCLRNSVSHQKMDTQDTPFSGCLPSALTTPNIPQHAEN